MKAILVHGFNVTDGGKHTTDRLRPWFESSGYDVEECDYGWIGLLGVRFLNKRFARKCKKMTTPGSIGIGHSNGCAILQAASLMGAPFEQIVLINPALDSDAKFGKQGKFIHVWYSPSDIPVRMARLLPFHTWGDMGAVGYTGDDPRFFSYNKEDRNRWKMPDGTPIVSKSHSDVFHASNLGFFAPRIIWSVRYAREQGKQWISTR